MIPNVPHCRFITIGQILQKIQEDSFTYKEVRFAGKVKSLIGETAEVEDLFDDKH